MTTIASTRTDVVHVVGLRHTSTGDLIAPYDPKLVPRPYGWFIRIVAHRVVVAARVGVPGLAAPPVLEVLVADGVLADALTYPVPVVGQRPRSFRVSLTAAQLDVPVVAAPRKLTVVLTHAGTGAPSAGRSVKVRGTSGPDLLLPETATPGTYQSAAELWDQRYTPGDLRVGATTVRKVGVDFRKADTRLYVVDPT